MTGRNPISFLFLEVPPELVDVNVHPTKSEVRFREGQRLYRQLLSTIRNRFLGLDLGSELAVPARPAFALQTAPRRAEPVRQRLVEQDLLAWVQEQTKDWGMPGYQPIYPPLEEEEASEAPPSIASAPRDPLLGDEAAVGDDPHSRFLRSDPVHPQPAGAAPDAGVDVSHAGQRPVFLGLRAMQIHDAYLVVETDEGLTVVDQHALHERILYEQLRKRVLAGTVESQRLLVPQPVELAPAEVTLLHEHADVLDQFGFGLEEFGTNTALLTAYPVMLRQVDPAQLVRNVAERLAGSAGDPDRRDLLDSLLHLLACKAAIKAGQRLSPEEIESLLAQRHLIDDAHHCPHGRPTALVLSRTELDRQFGRLG
jgi:DNA mismatch repair protein MutL